jgi:hypothetical protein
VSAWEEPQMAEDLPSPRKRTAHCNCGAPLTVATCFCEECQRRTGSAFGISTYWMRDKVTLTGSATRYVCDGQEGRKVIYYFCPTRGSRCLLGASGPTTRAAWDLRGVVFWIRISPLRRSRFGSSQGKAGSPFQILRVFSAESTATSVADLISAAAAGDRCCTPAADGTPSRPKKGWIPPARTATVRADLDSPCGMASRDPGSGSPEEFMPAWRRMAEGAGRTHNPCR